MFDNSIHMGYWPSVRSRWQDISHVLFWCVYMGQDGVEVCKLEANMQPSSPNKFGQQRIYHVFKGNFSCGTAACLEWAVKVLSNILPTWVANHIGVFDSSHPLMDPKPYKTYIMWILSMMWCIICHCCGWMGGARFITMIPFVKKGQVGKIVA